MLENAPISKIIPTFDIENQYSSVRPVLQEQHKFSVAAQLKRFQ